MNNRRFFLLCFNASNSNNFGITLGKGEKEIMI